MTWSLPLPRHAPPGPAATAVSADQISPGALCALPVLITRALASCCSGLTHSSCRHNSRASFAREQVPSASANRNHSTVVGFSMRTPIRTNFSCRRSTPYVSSAIER